MDTTMLKIIDSTSPFFERHPDMKINWSKVPFHHIEKDGVIKKKHRKKIRKNFSGYLKKIKKAGYNAISLDELPYLIEFSFYPVYLKEKTAHYRKYYKKLIAEAAKEKIKVFITSDVTFSNVSIETYTKGDHEKKVKLFNEALVRLFVAFPDVSGVILRIGESDGVDVQGDFLSYLLLRTPKQGNRFLKNILPVFDRFEKTCIFRTWTIGAYEIGDLIWNRRTYRKLFKDIDNPNLIVSLKYGDTDFFRYLKLNKHILQAPHRKLIEFQARREYEGFGEFPVYVGWEYRRYMKEILKINHIAGISVWCSTGGWSSFRNFTYIKRSSIWNELNTYATAELFAEKKPKEILYSFFKKNTVPVAKYLKAGDTVINTLLYDPGFAGNELYFNRTRIPPLLHVFWNSITVNEFVITLYRIFSNSTQSLNAIKKGRRALEKMKRLNHKYHIDKGFTFFYDTFIILYHIRNLMYSKNRVAIKRKLDTIINEYHRMYPGTYTFSISCNDRAENRTVLHILMKIIIRRKPHYRFIDYLLFNRFTTKLYYALYILYKSSFPGFTGKQAMPIKTFLR